MDEKILFVDDDEKILLAYKRHLRKKFTIDVANGGEEGLKAIRERGPFSVVVSDMRMPGMNGTEFLAEVREKAPKAVRLMLTGQADMEDTIDVVNKGHIFRFLTKPCLPEMMTGTLNDAIEQYRLVNAERELLEKTLLGSIKVMTGVLSLVNPAAFGCATRIKGYVRHMARDMRLKRLWRFEVAAMLSQTGCVTMTQETLLKLYAGQPLSGEEKEMYSAHPLVGSKMLLNIPRLDLVAFMIKKQQVPYSEYTDDDYASDRDRDISIGAQMLMAAHDLDHLITGGSSIKSAVSKMRGRELYNPLLLDSLDGMEETTREKVEIRAVNVNELKVGMVINEDVLSMSSMLLVSRGTEVTESVMLHLTSIAVNTGVKEPFRVLLGLES